MAGSAPLSEHPPVEHPEVRSAIDLLEAWIEAQRVARELPGVSLGIVHDQALVWSGGFGWADVERREPATADTLYRIGSITKLFTATALLSGLPREGAFPYFTDSRFPSIDEIRARLPLQERPFPTETRWKYSNLGATLAGEVVAAAAGEPYVDFVRRRILEPLGMTATLVASPDPALPRLATGYARRLLGSTPAPFNDLRGLTAAGNMTTSVADLARFAMLQLRGGAAGGAQILSGRTLAEMRRVHWLEPDWQAGWGLGFRVLRVRRKTLVGHGGSVRGFRSNLQICPADKVAVVAFVNSDDADAWLYVDKALEWVGDAIAGVTKPPSPTADPAWQRYVGRYRSAWRDVQVIVRGGELTVIGPDGPDPLLAPATLRPVGEHTFRVETTDGYGIPGELVVFETDPAGRVRRARFGENYTERIETWEDR